VKTMLLLRSATMVLSLGIGSAGAGDGDSAVANTLFTEIPGVVGQPPAQNAPVVATVQNGQAMENYVSGSDRTTWMFPPVGKYLAQ
jgi:hypothetical protein